MTRNARSRWLLELAVCLAFAALGVIAALAPGGLAADKASKPAKEIVLPEPLTKEAVHELVARLSDDEVRRLLLAQLDRAAAKSAQAAEGAGAVASGMDAETGRLRDRLAAVLGVAPEPPSTLPLTVARLAEGSDTDHLLLLMKAVGTPRGESCTNLGVDQSVGAGHQDLLKHCDEHGSPNTQW
jgi:hypothetical protein